MGIFSWNKAVSGETGPLSPLADSSHLETLTIADLYGTTPEEMPVNRSTAMQIAAVAKGRNLICTSIARMPLLAVKVGVPLDSQPAVLRQLTPGMPNFIVLSWVVDSLIFYGRTYLLITARSADGKPASVRYVPEGEAETQDGRLVRAFGQSVKADGYIRIDAPHEGILSYGKTVLRTAREVIQASAEAGANPIPHVVLQQKEGAELRQDEVNSLLSGWRASRRRRGGSAAFLSKGIQAEALGQSAENLLIAGQNNATLEIARLLGLPAHTLDGSVAGTALNYQNQASRNRELIDSLTPYIEAIQQTFALYLPTGTEAVFDTTELLRPDTKGRYDEYAVALSSGFLTVDEVRQRENLAPLPEQSQTTPQEDTE